MRNSRATPAKKRASAAKAPAAKILGAKDALDGLLEQIERGRARVPVARKGKPQAVLISMAEFERLRAIDESPHAEIIGRLLFAR